MDRQRCGRCKVNLPLDRFKVKRCGNTQKLCIECNAKAAARQAARRCEHGRQRQTCRECGGTSICEHGRQRQTCRECGGSSICEHGRQRAQCRECDPCGHLRNIVANRIRNALTADKDRGSLEYLGCSIVEFKAHIEAQFEPEMTWENYGKVKVDGPRVWQIDHIVPIKFEQTPGVPPTLEEVAARLHWTNCQPMWGEENIAKGNRFVGRVTPEPAPAQAPADSEPAPGPKLTDADIDELFADLGI